MKELRIQVERVVRPIHASETRKDKIREELLSYLVNIYDEERARSADDRIVLDRVIERFGKPDELRRDLQSSIPIPERFLFSKLPIITRRHYSTDKNYRRLSRHGGEKALP